MSETQESESACLQALIEDPVSRPCQTKFYTACLRAGTRWSSTVFAHELPPRSASFEAENGLYSFALTRPARIVFVLMTRGGQYDDRPVAA